MTGHESVPNQSTCVLWIRRLMILSLKVFIIFMHTISRCSQVVEGVGFSCLLCLLFADDVVLLAFCKSDLQLSLRQFAANCQAPGKRITISESKIMVLNQKMVDFPTSGWRRVSSPNGGAQVFWGLVYE